jgi:hypothetical protein
MKRGRGRGTKSLIEVRNGIGEKAIEHEAVWLNMALHAGLGSTLIGLIGVLGDHQIRQQGGWDNSRIYQNYNHLLLDKGDHWSAEQVTLYKDIPAERKQAKERGWPWKLKPRRDLDCYPSAIELAARRCGFEYVEGWALVNVPLDNGSDSAPVITHHGWNYNPETGEVVEGMWPWIAQEYLGIVFPWEYVIEAARKTETFGVLVNDDSNGYELLRKEVDQWQVQEA